MNSPEFLDAVRARHSLTSDRKLARFLGLPEGRISLYRTGKRTISPADSHLVAAALEEPVEYVLASVQAERAKRTADRAAWRRLADLARKSQAAALLACVLLVGGMGALPDQVARAGQCILWQIARARRIAASLLRALRRSESPCTDPWHYREHRLATRCPSCGDLWYPGRPGPYDPPVTHVIARRGHTWTIFPMKRARAAGRALRFGLVLPIVAAVTACGSMSPAERAWQAMHLVDVAQTVNGPAQDPCYAEGTSTRFLIGEQPSTGSVVAWGAALAVVHYYAGAWLDRSELPGGVKLVLRSIDLGYKGATITNNHRLGVRPWGDNQCPH